MWRAAWDKDATLTSTQLRILELLRRRLNKDNVCWPSQRTLARDCNNVSVRTVGRALKALDGRWIERTRRFNPRSGNRTSDLITICFPSEDQLFLRNLNPDRFDMPTTHGVKNRSTASGDVNPSSEGSFLTLEQGGLTDILSPGPSDKMSEEPSVQREPQDNDLQAALCRSMQAPRREAGAALERGRGLAEKEDTPKPEPGHIDQPPIQQAMQDEGPKEPQVTAQAPQETTQEEPGGDSPEQASCPGTCPEAFLEPGIEQVCSLWRELLKDPEYEQERRYTYRALQVSMVQGYNAKVLLTALAMLLDKLAHRKRDLLPVKDIRAYYSALLGVADQDPERTGGGQEQRCRHWSRVQLEQIKQGRRLHQVLAGPERSRTIQPRPEQEPTRPPTTPLVMPGWSPPHRTLQDIAQMVRQLHKASPKVVAQGILCSVQGELEEMASAWLAAGGPDDALAYLQEVHQERCAMGFAP